jgi:hypothetical protein
MNTRTIYIALLVVGPAAMGQVHLNKPLVLTAPDSTQRSIEGLAPASQENALITLDGARSGAYHWGQAGGNGTALTLALQPVCAGYANGLSVRFMPVTPASGAVTLNVDGLGARPIYRGDGLLVSAGQLQPGIIAEAVYADSAFFLRSRAAQGCPTGYLQANSRLCLMRNDTINLSIYNAGKWCTDRGAMLCTWDEYIAACTALLPQLEGTFDDWEWVDDTSDHTHTGVQVGRYACRTQRSWGAQEDPNNYARVRCCYHIR